MFIDKDFKCHTSNPDGEYREIETDIFSGKCDAYIEGYQYIPPGESWEREDGVVFHGEMLSPWKDFDELDAAQREYEKQKLTESTEALIVLGVKV